MYFINIDLFNISSYDYFLSSLQGDGVVKIMMLSYSRQLIRFKGAV